MRYKELQAKYEYLLDRFIDIFRADVSDIKILKQRITKLETENKELKEHITPVQWRYAKGLQGIESPIAEIPE